VLIAQAVFLLERGRTNKQTDIQKRLTEYPTHAAGYTADVGNNNNNNNNNNVVQKWPLSATVFQHPHGLYHLSRKDKLLTCEAAGGELMARISARANMW